MGKPLLELLMADDFAQLQGLSITGSIPLQQQVINEALDKLLENWAKNKARDASGSRPDYARFLQLVRRVNVRVEAGVVYVDVEIRA